MSRDRDLKPGEAVAELVDSVLRLSASLAQVVAEAATGKPQAARPGDTHLQTLVRHGTTAAAGFVSTVISAARTPGAAGRAAGAAPAPARVVAGSSLRLPLSVDNPGAEPMVGIVPKVTAIAHRNTPRPGGLEVTFAPEVLTIAPRDFEKLTVSVTVPKGTEPGVWAVTFCLTGQAGDGQDAAPITITLPIEIVA